MPPLAQIRAWRGRFRGPSTQRWQGDFAEILCSQVCGITCVLPFIVTYSLWLYQEHVDENAFFHDQIAPFMPASSLLMLFDSQLFIAQHIAKVVKLDISTLLGCSSQFLRRYQRHVVGRIM